MATTFAAKPKRTSEEAARAAFVAGAESRDVPKDSAEPQLDPDAPPNRSMSLRLNEYELARLRTASKRMRRSVQQVIKTAIAQMLDELEEQSPRERK